MSTSTTRVCAPAKNSPILFAKGDAIRASDHPLVSAVSVPALNAQHLTDAPRGGSEALVRWMQDQSSGRTMAIEP